MLTTVTGMNYAIQKLTENLKAFLADKDADIIGIGNMGDVENCNYRTGISIAVRQPKKFVLDLQKAHAMEYYELYHTLNVKLNEIVLAGEEFLKENGFDPYARTTDRVKTNEDKISPIPHKTVATRAGIGWIGKNCLLVTPQYGSAIRLSSILTDAPLNFYEPINESRCGQCRKCLEKCPAQALYCTLWNTYFKRDMRLDFRKCYDKQMEISGQSGEESNYLK